MLDKSTDGTGLESDPNAKKAGGMSEDRVHVVARLIRTLTANELVQLRRVLAEDDSGDPTGVGALIPPDLPLKEGGAEAPFEEWSSDYFENME